MSQTGIERIKKPDPFEDEVLVRDSGGNDRELPESIYRERGYLPLIESLPWRK